MTANWLQFPIFNSTIDDHAKENNFSYLDTLKFDLIVEGFKRHGFGPYSKL